VGGGGEAISEGGGGGVFADFQQDARLERRKREGEKTKTPSSPPQKTTQEGRNAKEATGRGASGGKEKT